MEDAKNTFPSSKKRAAEQELSRDTHHNEKDYCYLATGIIERHGDELEYGWGVFKTCNGFVWIVVSILSVAVRRWLGSI
ncbi:mannan endo-1,4-beta-mannosidase [Trifolium repens]|nr:mannan endo-1,4-beta-mannosidase [Trifolium repens]